VSKKDLTGDSVEYYVLKPLSDATATIYVPVDNEALVGKMRGVLSKDEIYDLIAAIPAEETIWMDDEFARRTRYEKILSSGDRSELSRLIKTLYQRRESLKERGKKLDMADARLMRDAERILYEEFSHVLDIKREKVLPFILEKIESRN
jgi:CarD family transcriptional regulator